MATARRSQLLLAAWVVLCLSWAGAACAISYLCPSFVQGERVFQYVGQTPEVDKLRAKQEEIDRCEARLTFLALGSPAVALIGAVAFYRRGCGVFILAAALVAVCFVAQCAIYPFY